MQFLQQQNPRGQLQLVEKMTKDIESVSKSFSKTYKRDPTGAFKELVKVVDECIREIPAADKQDFSCRKGCSFCCHMNVDAFKEEALIIARHCRKKGISIDKEYLKVQLTIPAADIGWTEHSACVFLKDGQCSIYDVRPIFCRKYFVYTPKEDCEMRPGVAPKRVASHFDYRTEIYNAAVLTAGLVPGRLPAQLLSFL